MENVGIVTFTVLIAVVFYLMHQLKKGGKKSNQG